MPISAIVFDFDGVLADTERLHLAAFQEVLGRRGWALDEATYFDRYLGYDDGGLVRAFAKDQKVTLDKPAIARLVDAKTAVFSQHLDRGDVLFPDAADCVASLAAHYPLAIASGALREEITAILSANHLLDYFKVIVSANDVDECKPSPVPYLTAARQLGVDPRACVAIEDSIPGLQAARAAGMWTVAITTTSPRSAFAEGQDTIDALCELSIDRINAVPTRARVP